MRYILIGLIALLLILPVQAQATCADAAENSANLLDTALTLLNAGNAEGATTIIASARDALVGCVPGGGAAAPVQDDTTSAETPAETTTSSAPPVSTSGSGEYNLIQPDFNTEQSIAFVRFTHTSVDGGPIDLYFGRSEVLVLENLDYGEVTELITINAGDWTFTARPAGSGPDGDVLYRLRWNFISNSSWVVTAAGLAENFSFIVEPISILRDNYDGKARVRIVNLAAGAPRTTVTTTRQTLGDRLGWVGSRDTLLEPGEYTLEASTSEGASLSQPITFNFEADITYTLMVVGRGTEDYPLTFLPFETPQDVTRVRFINNRADVIDIYARPGNEAIVSTFDPQTETDWFTFPSGSMTFYAVDAGAGPGGRQLAGLPWQLRPGRDMVIEIDAGGMRVQDVSLTEFGD